MKIYIYLLAFILLTGTFTARPQQKVQQRCGWFENPTPANAWLTDKEGSWIISTQGGSSADGDWPIFSPKRWIKTNVSYGYGCACMKLETNATTKSVTRILSATSRPIAACRRDKTIAKKEPRP
jgi:hypothetical protein